MGEDERVGLASQVWVARHVRLQRLPYQIGISAFVFAIAFVLSRDDGILASRIFLPSQTAASFMAVVAQSLAAIIGFTFVFLALSLEYVGSERGRLFDVYRSKVEDMARLAAACPPDCEVARRLIIRIYGVLEDFTVDNIVVTGAEYQETIVPLVERLARVKRKFADDTAIDDYLREVFVVLISIENIYRRVFVPYIGSIVLPIDYRVFPKLLALFLLSLLLLLVFGAVDLTNSIPDLLVPILLSLLSFLILVLFEVYRVINRIFRNLVERG